jgi:general L-amino acid transport system permease protein
MLLYVEAFRNVPLLLYLFLWYALIIVSLPSVQQSFNPLPGVYLSNGGLFVPAMDWSPAHTGVALALVLGLFASMRYGKKMREERIRTGQDKVTWPMRMALLVGPAVIALIVLRPDLSISVPELGRFRMSGGTHWTPEFTALLVGLALSTSAGVAEIVRSGIQSVTKGQWEASRALGLHDRKAMRLIILPQALRVIIPPLTSTYLSLFKNSSLAIAIGYPDLVMVSNNTMTQTGQAIEAIAIFMVVYLGISLTISYGMNIYNARVALKER